MKLKDFLFEEIYNDNTYKSWKRKNVTVRGIKEPGSENGIVGSFGKGLYTAYLSNVKMASGYGDVYFIVNAIPQKPKIVNSLNDAEILRQDIIARFCKARGVSYSPSFFNNETTMDVEMIKMGFDGLIIKGRELVNYKPNEDKLQYFKTESGLYDYFINYVKK